MKMRLTILALISALLAFGCGVQIKPLQSTIDKMQAKKKAKAVNPNAVFKIFDEDNLCDEGCVLSQYAYPEATSKVTVTDAAAHSGEVSAQFDLDQKDYSGGCIYIGTLTLSAGPFYARGALDFWIKGAVGGEKCYIILTDEEKNENINVEVSVPLANYAQVTTGWTHVSIPLQDFGRRGTVYDSIKDMEIPHAMDWSQLYGIIVATDKGANESFRVWVDDIYIMKDVYGAVVEKKDRYWDERVEVVPAPPIASRPAVTPVTTLYKSSFLKGASATAEGGRTAFRIQSTTEPQKVPGVLALYMDNQDDAAAYLNLPAATDLTQLRAAKGGIAFWAKFGKGISNVHFGLLDNKYNNKSKLVQTNVQLGDYSAIDTNWHYITIPLRDFNAQAGWYDEARDASIPDDATFRKIVQLCFITDKFANRVEEKAPAAIYVDDVAFIKEVPGYVNPDDYWNAFKSPAPDITLFDFDDPNDADWDPSPGNGSEMFFHIVDRDETADDESKALEAEYELNDWADLTYNFLKSSALAAHRDWSKYYALRFSAYTDKKEELLQVQVNDAGGEAFFTRCALKKGWNDILLPFRLFMKDPDNQESDSDRNGKLDLQAVTALDFKPAAVGTKGKIKFADIRITNVRELK